jgi:hypothetical protein
VHWPVMNVERPSRAALLGVVIGEDHAFLGDTVDVRGVKSHQAHGVGTNVRLADVISKNDEDIRLFRFLLLRITNIR